MSKGPKFNKLSEKINTRDNLGINGVAASMQAELCPVINTVTPRAFYWPFMVWNYYDFFENSGITEHTTKVFDEQFLKINDYYFVLSNLITENPDRYNLVGQDKTGADLRNNPNGPFPFNSEYFVTRFGGMQYYNAGCLTMGYTTETTKDNERLKMPHPTKALGEPMAKAFEEVIKDTEYYKEYRGKNTLVPRSVLQELGEVLTLDLRNFEECKRLLRESLFSPKANIKLNNKYLIQSAEYAKFIYKTCPSFRGKPLSEFRLADMREVLFDYYSPAGFCRYEHDSSLDYIMMRWEVVVGRQYFTMALELIWKHLMKALEAQINLYLQNRKTRIKEKAASDLGAKTFIYDTIGERPAFYHGKVFRFITSDKEYILYGSANCTASAILKTPKTDGNVECDILEFGDKGAFDGFFEAFLNPCEGEVSFDLFTYNSDNTNKFFFRYGVAEDNYVKLYIGCYNIASNFSVLWCGIEQPYTSENDSIVIKLPIEEVAQTETESDFSLDIQYEDKTETLICWYNNAEIISINREKERKGAVYKFNPFSTGSDFYNDRTAILKWISMTPEEVEEEVHVMAVMHPDNTDDNPEEADDDEGVIDYTIPEKSCVDKYEQYMYAQKCCTTLANDYFGRHETQGKSHIIRRA